MRIRLSKCDYEDSTFLWCEALTLSKSFPTFEGMSRNLFMRSQSMKSIHDGVVTL
jgi:hypothetical protein